MRQTDFAAQVTGAMDLCLNITAAVYSALSTTGNELEWDKKKLLDGINTAAFIIDNGIVDLCIGLLSLGTTVQKAEFGLTSSGIINMDGQGITKVFQTESEIASPSPSIQKQLLAAQLALQFAEFANSAAGAGIKIDTLVKEFNNHKEGQSQ